MPYSQQAGFINPYPFYPGYQTNYGKLRVEGTGGIKVEPDIAIVSMGVVTENKQLKIAQEQNAMIANKIINTLKSMGIPSEDIQTQSYNIDPQYDYIEGKQVFRDYRVSHILRVTIRDMARVGEIIDAAVESGANTINNISFTVSDPSAYYQEALKAAIDDALAKAMTIGSKLRIAVSQIPVQIIERGYQNDISPKPVLMQSIESTTPIMTGQAEITARIEAVFAYTQL